MIRAGVLVLLAAATGCGDAITLEIASDRPIPTAIDSMCVGVADTSLDGGHFGQHYRLADALATLPQTLRLESGSADSALAWVRGDRAGVPAAYASAQIKFDGDVTLSLAKCQLGPEGGPSVRGDAAGPASALIAASHGQGGTIVLAIAPGASAALQVRNGKLVAVDAPALPAGMPKAIITADLDGDCDDDAIVATDGAAPTIWLRDRATFTAADTIGDAPVSAIAAGDLDQDGDTDVILGGGNSLQLWRNDGSGALTLAMGALSAGTRATAISALALGDLDGDGNPDLVVGQAGPPLVAWLGGIASFTPADGVLPAVSLDVKRLTLVDADNDFDPDLAVAVNGAAMRLYVDRDGRLEDQTFVRIPSPPRANAIAFANWDAGCEADAVVATDAGAPTLRGKPGGSFDADAAAPAATDVLMTDADDDGDVDAVFATPEGVTWLAR